jgi:hypothetical protein
MDDKPVLSDLEIACYRFSLRATQPIVLPVYKGSTFHGGFGHALNRIGKRFRNYFFTSSSKQHPNNRKALPKPFMLIPPLEEKTRYLPGEEMHCGLMLFGEAIRHFMIAFAALEHLGRELGLGRDQGRFQIHAVEQLSLNEPHRLFLDDTWYPPAKPISARKIINAHQIDAGQVTLHLVTRLRLKNNNRLVREPPSFAIFFDRLMGRINTLAAFYGGGMLMSRHKKHFLLQSAAMIHRDHLSTTARWSERERPPKPGKAEMSFGGLMGMVVYHGNLRPFIPWMVLGQWTGIGGKTSFGLGLYEMEVTK